MPRPVTTARQAELVGCPGARGLAEAVKGGRHMPGTDAIPYVCARSPGVVNHPPAPVARAKTLLRGTLVGDCSLVCLNGCSSDLDCGTRHTVASATVTCLRHSSNGRQRKGTQKCSTEQRLGALNRRGWVVDHPGRACAHVRYGIRAGYVPAASRRPGSPPRGRTSDHVCLACVQGLMTVCTAAGLDKVCGPG